MKEYMVTCMWHVLNVAAAEGGCKGNKFGSPLLPHQTPPSNRRGLLRQLAMRFPSLSVYNHWLSERRLQDQQ